MIRARPRSQNTADAVSSTASAISKARLKSLVTRLLRWFPTHARDLPWRRTRDPYAVWISEIMLQQTQVMTVIPYFERWLRELPDVAALAAAPEQRVLKLWEGLGYYTRARNLRRAAQVILRERGGQFPEDLDAMLALPGIGRYTAGAIGSIAFNQPSPILDGNVIRVLTRLFGVEENPREPATNRRLWQLAEALVAQAATLEAPATPLATGASSALNQSLMELGAQVCTPRQPKCGACPLGRSCLAHRTGRTELLPKLASRAPTMKLRFLTFVLEQGGRYLVRQRGTGVVNGGLWEFPNMEITAGEHAPAKVAREIFGSAVPRLEPWCEFRHTITRYRISQRVFRGTMGKARKESGLMKGLRWLTPAEIGELAFTGAHAKLARRLV